MSTNSARASTYVTPEGLGSFLNLLEAKAWEALPGEPPRKPTYSMTLVFPPGGEQKYLQGKAELKTLKAAAIAVAKDFFGDKKLAELSKAGKFRSPFLQDDEQCGKYGWPLGSTFLRLSSLSKPNVVGPWRDKDGKPREMTDAEILEHCYPGARYRVSVRPYGYDKKGNRGVSLALCNVQWLGDDTRIDGRSNAKDDFTATAEPADIFDEVMAPTASDEVDLSTVL